MPDGQAGNPGTSLPKRFARAAFVAVVDLLRRHSITLAVAALLGIYTSKIWWHIGSMARPGGMKTPFLAFFADDLLFWAAVIALILAAETYLRQRWVRVVTTAVAVLLAIPSLANVFWLRGTGTQLSLSVIEVGLTRTAEVLPIIEAGLGPIGITLLLGGLVLIVGLPFLFRSKWRKDGRDERPRPVNFAFPALLLLLGGLGLVEQRSASDPGWKLVASNVQVSLVAQYLGRPELRPPPASVPDPSPPPSVPRADERSPNVIVVALEATAYRATSLDPIGPRSTPTLARLAREGLEATSMRAVLPHTTKSLFSFLCGRYPAMQQQILETADNYPMRCLPQILADNGWKTAFFQSADGRFEDRPRLVSKMGFEHFTAWPQIDPPVKPLSYLAADDMGLVDPVLRWTGEQTAPYFVAILTSAAHHAYELPDWLAELTGVTNDDTEPRRYAALVHGSDLMLRSILDGLAEHESARDTIVVVFGDHGEAFGEHAGRQHDNIFTEEGLHVPFVIHAPGRVPAGKITEPRSLVDVTPTVLDLVGVPYAVERFDGRSLVRPGDDVPRRFACWYDNVCAGEVRGHQKLVHLPDIATWLEFDLAGDPGELEPQIDPDGISERGDAITSWYNEHRYTADTLEWSEQLLYDGRWRCAAKQTACQPVRN
jgi:hypothetical protein